MTYSVNIKAVSVDEEVLDRAFWLSNSTQTPAYGTLGYIESYDEDKDEMVIRNPEVHGFARIQNYEANCGDTLIVETNHPEFYMPLIKAELEHFDTEVTIIGN